MILTKPGGRRIFIDKRKIVFIFYSEKDGRHHVSFVFNEAPTITVELNCAAQLREVAPELYPKLPNDKPHPVLDIQIEDRAERSAEAEN